MALKAIGKSMKTDLNPADKPTMETPEQCVKSAQSYQQRHQNNGSCTL